jgi:hypothetical protein
VAHYRTKLISQSRKSMPFNREYLSQRTFFDMSWLHKTMGRIPLWAPARMRGEAGERSVTQIISQAAQLRRPSCFCVANKSYNAGLRVSQNLVASTHEQSEKQFRIIGGSDWIAG